MTRTSHSIHPTGIPIFSLGFVSDRTLVLGGGGGMSKTGVMNKLRVCNIKKEAAEVETICELEMGLNEDAPMSMAVDVPSKRIAAGVNSSPTQVAAGENQSCRVYELNAESQLEEVIKKGTFAIKPDDFQKTVAISKDSSLIAVGSDSLQLSIRKFPSLEEAFLPIEYEGLRPGDLCSVDFNENSDLLAIATPKNIYIYRVKSEDEEKKISEKEGSKLEKPALIHTITREKVATNTFSTNLSFRAAKFGNGPTANRLYTALNTIKPYKKGEPLKSLICFFDGKDSKWTGSRTQVLAKKPVTVLDVSVSGKMLAFGGADLSVGVLDAVTMGPLLRILAAHEFPPTAIAFNPSGDLLVSASALANSIRVIVIPTDFSSSWGTVIMILIALLVILLGVLYQQLMA